ncbi:macrophage mannose receptor 1-like [Channa argus]|uniref:macrophage mannose receptor 1-like n=1 Tax=Channa argus TaxID=215402 RepID=UPI00351FBBF9
MMKRILLLVFCFSGWSLSHCLLFEYHYVPDFKTWNEAQTYCRQTYTDLATIENTQEMNQLINTVSSAGYNSEVWIGLYNQINWRWSDGYTGNGAGYRNWKTAANQPDFDSADQFFVSIGSDGQWWDDYSFVKHPFICYRAETLQNPQLFFINELKNWTSAQSYCRKNFTDLVTVRNNAENREILNLVQENSWAWIGLFREPNFYWSDQTIFSFSNWDDVLNLAGSVNVICGIADLQKSGKWKFLPCDTKRPFVCYSKTVRKQVVRLMMKLEDSSVDLNDPAVKADLLKQFQDRLKDNGLSDVTLKWREQPDGKVFHKNQKKN